MQEIQNENVFLKEQNDILQTQINTNQKFDYLSKKRSSSCKSANETHNNICSPPINQKSFSKK